MSENLKGLSLDGAIACLQMLRKTTDGSAKVMRMDGAELGILSTIQNVRVGNILDGDKVISVVVFE